MRVLQYALELPNPSVCHEAPTYQTLIRGVRVPSALAMPDIVAMLAGVWHQNPTVCRYFASQIAAAPMVMLYVVALERITR